jgi:hypothetical protein
LWAPLATPSELTMAILPYDASYIFIAVFADWENFPLCRGAQIFGVRGQRL